MIRVEHGQGAEAGVAFVVLDDPDASANTLTEAMGRALEAALGRIQGDPAVRAAVLTSGKADFVLGANLDMLKAVRFSGDAERLARDAAALAARLRSGSKPVVAAVGGAALGGGLELALACRAIVIANDKRTTLGLPEIKLGLIPGANGLLRVAERAGLEVAIDLGLTGRNVRPSKAKALGLVDEVCPPAILRAVAARRALELAGGVPGAAPAARRARRPTRSALAALALEANAIGRRVLFRKAREAMREKTRGHYPAAERVLDVLELFGKNGFVAAADLEARAFGELVVSETAHRLLDVYFATQALKKDPGVDDPDVRARAVAKVGVLGGGLMGGGIAFVTVGAGVPVRLKERDDAGVGRGLGHVRGLLDERVRRKRATALERDQTWALVTGTTDLTGFATCDVVVEAVFEDLALKQAILRDVEAITRPDCVFATNTSSIPVARIAAASRRPETVLGMHYFSPVHKMPLLEVVRTPDTAPWALATAVALGKKQGKTVVVVNDGVGFYTSRVLAPYMNEAAWLVAEGASVEAIDRALVDWGWPVGAVQLLDEVGIDVGAHVGEIVHAAFGARLAPPPGMAKLLADDRKGRKNRRGFYAYDANGKRGGVDASVYAALGLDAPGKGPRVPAEEIQMRCAFQMVNEALLCFGEGVLRSARDGDVGAVFGLGFPPFRGGPFRYVDALGAAEVLRRVQGYADRFGARWTPAPALVAMARRGDRFHV